MIVIPLKEKNIGGLAADGFQVVPILCYHRFEDDCQSPLCMPAHIFEQQMKYLYENGYRNALTWKQLAIMKADGFEVGTHTVSHSDLTRQEEGEDAQAFLARIEKELRLFVTVHGQ